MRNENIIEYKKKVDRIIIRYIGTYFLGIWLLWKSNYEINTGDKKYNFLQSEKQIKSLYFKTRVISTKKRQDNNLYLKKYNINKDNGYQNNRESYKKNKFLFYH